MTQEVVVPYHLAVRTERKVLRPRRGIDAFVLIEVVRGVCRRGSVPGRGRGVSDAVVGIRRDVAGDCIRGNFAAAVVGERVAAAGDRTRDDVVGVGHAADGISAYVRHGETGQRIKRRHLRSSGTGIGIRDIRDGRNGANHAAEEIEADDGIRHGR